MAADASPQNAITARPNNLPAPTTRLIGREQQIDEIRRLVGSSRLLTLTGAGGCGKTRLVLQLAADISEMYVDGVWLVDLAALADAELVPQGGRPDRRPAGRSRSSRYGWSQTTCGTT